MGPVCEPGEEPVHAMERELSVKRIAPTSATPPTLRYDDHSSATTVEVPRSSMRVSASASAGEASPKELLSKAADLARESWEDKLKVKQRSRTQTSEELEEMAFNAQQDETDSEARALLDSIQSNRPRAGTPPQAEPEPEPEHEHELAPLAEPEPEASLETSRGLGSTCSLARP